jgi:hypothetical protein
MVSAGNRRQIDKHISASTRAYCFFLCLCPAYCCFVLGSIVSFYCVCVRVCLCVRAIVCVCMCKKGRKKVVTFYIIDTVHCHQTQNTEPTNALLLLLLLLLYIIHYSPSNQPNMFRSLPGIIIRDTCGSINYLN